MYDRKPPDASHMLKSLSISALAGPGAESEVKEPEEKPKTYLQPEHVHDIMTAGETTVKPEHGAEETDEDQHLCLNKDVEDKAFTHARDAYLAAHKAYTAGHTAGQAAKRVTV